MDIGGDDLGGDRAVVGCDGGDAESEGFWVGAGVGDRGLVSLIMQFFGGFPTMGENLDAVSFASLSAMPELDEKKPESDEKKPEKKEEKSPWNELLGNFLIKAVPALIAGGVSGLVPIVKGDELPKAALYAGIGGVGGGIATIVYAFVEPTLKKTKKGAEQVGEATADRLERLTQAGIAKATGAEAKYLEAQQKACWTDRCQGLMQSLVPLLEEIFVPLSISGTETFPG